MAKDVGGRRIGNAERDRIITAYLDFGKSAADEIAVGEYKLAADYAYKLVNSRGLLPRRYTRENNQ